MAKEFFTWRGDWSLHIDLLDSQHRELSVCLNRVARCCIPSESSGENGVRTIDTRAVRRLVEAVYRCAQRHFSDEEALMQIKKYPGYIAHRREHVLLLAELKCLLRESTDPSSPIARETLVALKTWFIGHMADSDRQFAIYLSGLADSSEHRR